MSWLPWNPRTCALTACNIPCMPVLLQYSMHLLCSSVFELSIKNFLARPPLPVCSSGFAAIELLLPVAPLLLSFRCTPRAFCALLSSLFTSLVLHALSSCCAPLSRPSRVAQACAWLFLCRVELSAELRWLSPLGLS